MGEREGEREGRWEGETERPEVRQEDRTKHEFFLSSYVVLTISYLTPRKSVYCLSRILGTELCMPACFHRQYDYCIIGFGSIHKKFIFS